VEEPFLFHPAALHTRTSSPLHQASADRAGVRERPVRRGLLRWRLRERSVRRGLLRERPVRRGLLRWRPVRRGLLRWRLLASQTALVSRALRNCTNLNRNLLSTNCTQDLKHLQSGKPTDTSTIHPTG